MRSTSYPIEIEDQTGYTFRLDNYPSRVISLVPSITATLYDLGLSDLVTGRTKFCIHPQPAVRAAQVVGGTKTVHLDRIHKLKPDLILGNKEENEKHCIEQLRKEYPVYTSDIVDLLSSFTMMRDLGRIFNRLDAVEIAIAAIETAFQSVRAWHGKRCAYLIWRDPYMTVNADTFIHDMIRKMDLMNVFATNKERYPAIDLKELQNAHPDVVFLSSEPYPFKEKHVRELYDQLPNSRILLVDGECFSWYGSRMINSAAHFNQLYTQYFLNDV